MKTNILIYYKLEKNAKSTMFSLKILILSCMIILYIAQKIFCSYYLQAFRTEEILKRHIKYKKRHINAKQKIKMPKKGEYVKFRNYERKAKSPFIIYADF